MIVTGMIKGNVEVTEDLEISPTGKIFGDVITKNLIIKKGSTFVGKTTMPEGEKPKTDLSDISGEKGELIDKLEKVEEKKQEPEKETQEK